MAFQADRILIDRLSSLSELELTELEIEQTQKEITSFGVFFDQLLELDVSGIETLTNLSHLPMKLREDKEEESEISINEKLIKVSKIL